MNQLVWDSLLSVAFSVHLTWREMSFELSTCFFFYIWRVCPLSLAALGAIEGFILTIFILMYLLDKEQKALHLIFSNQREKSKYLMSQTSINTEYNGFGFFPYGILTAVTQMPPCKASIWMVLQDGAAPSQHNNPY